MLGPALFQMLDRTAPGSTAHDCTSCHGIASCCASSSQVEAHGQHGTSFTVAIYQVSSAVVDESERAARREKWGEAKAVLKAAGVHRGCLSRRAGRGI